MGTQSLLGNIVIAARRGSGLVVPAQFRGGAASGVRLRSITRALQRAGRWPVDEVRPQPKRHSRKWRRAEQAFMEAELTRRRRGPRSLKGRLLADLRVYDEVTT